MADLIGMIQVLLFLFLPLLLPLILRKRRWITVAACGYLLYAGWGVLLHFTADITEYGTGYGMLMVPYLIVLTVIGLAAESAKTNQEKKGQQQ